MKFSSTAMTLTTVAGILSALLAAATLWLLLTEPATVATAVNDHSLAPMLDSLARALAQTVVSLLKYL
jgi:hypothetical protein